MCDNTHVDEKYIRELAEHIILQIGKESSEVYTVLYKYIPEEKPSEQLKKNDNI